LHTFDRSASSIDVFDGERPEQTFSGGFTQD
jgi:hypothetical protein